MSWRWVLAVGLMVLSACVPDPSPTPGSDESLSPSPVVTTGTASELSTTTSVDEAEPLVIEVLGDLDPTLGTRVRELGNYGYGARPAVPSPVHDVPDLGAMFPSLTVREIDLNWGIDSSALLVTADGDPDVIDEAEAQLADSTRWVLAGENWVAGIYQGGLAARFEMEALVETISWIMDPGSACQQGEIACPLGPEVGFPPPPPRLVVNDEIDDEAVPFEVVEIEGASLVEADGVSAMWIVDSQAFTAWGVPSDPPETQARGPALVATSIGSYAFLVDPAGDGSGSNTLALRPCCEETNQVEWPVPAGWLIDGLALIGNFRQDDYWLIITAGVDDDSVAVGVPISENIFKPQATIPDLEGGIESLPRLNPPGRPWTLPRRNDIGGLSVVEERPDGWYLIEDALGDSRDLFRANYPIISYATDSGNRHIVAVVDGPDGPSTWWIQDDDLTRLEGSATSVAWNGWHTRY